MRTIADTNYKSPCLQQTTMVLAKLCVVLRAPRREVSANEMPEKGERRYGDLVLSFFDPPRFDARSYSLIS